MNRRIGLIAIAVVLALVGTVAVYSYAHNADKRAVQATRAAKVLIVQKRIPSGTKWSDVVKGGFVSQENVPVDSAPTSAVQNLDGTVASNDVATADVAPGQIVVRPMFGSRTPTTGVLEIPKGEQALSVSLAANADVAGFVQAGSQVAIYATFKVSKDSKNAAQAGIAGGTDIYTTKMLLPRVDVVAVSQGAPSKVNGSATSTSGTGNVLVTFALSQDEAQRLILSQQIGTLYLGLLTDSSAVATDGGVINQAVLNPAPIFVK